MSLLLWILSIPLVFAVLFFSAFIPYIYITWRSRKLPGPDCDFIMGSFPWKHIQNPTEMMKWMEVKAEEARARGEHFIRMRVLCFIATFAIDGEGLKPLLDSHEEITKGHDYEIMHPWMGDGLLFSTGDKWKARRRMLTPSFHFAVLQGHAELIDRHARILIEMIDEQRHGVVDIYERMRLCALDIICDTAMSYDLGAQRDPNQPYVKAVGEFNHIASIYAMDPRLHIGPVWWMTYKWRFDELTRTLKSFTQRVIETRLWEYDNEEEKGGRKAFLDMLIEMRKNNGLTVEDMREEVDTFMFAGHDTTSSAMTWILWCFATNPAIAKKAHAEVARIFEHSDRECTMADVSRMNYLERCIKESMRLFSPVPTVGRHLMKDFTIDGHIIPKGSDLFISPSLVHVNSKVYENPRVFDPDRFLPDNIAKRHPYDFVPFSAGARNCIGQKFAMIEMKVIVSWVLRRFTFSTSMDQDDAVVVPEVILRPGNILPITFTPIS